MTPTINYFVNQRIQQYFNELNLPQTDTKLLAKHVVCALRKKGAIQASQASESDSVFVCPFEKRNDDIGMQYLKHNDLRLSYTFSNGWDIQNDGNCLNISMGKFATYHCNKESTESVADEIIQIDTKLVNMWCKEFETLHPLEVTDIVRHLFYDYATHDFGENPMIYDYIAAHVLDVSRAEARRIISYKSKRFPEHSVIRLTKDQTKALSPERLRSMEYAHNRYCPYLLTFAGFFSLCMELHSEVAVKCTMGIIQTVSEKTPIEKLLAKLKEGLIR